MLPSLLQRDPKNPMHDAVEISCACSSAGEQSTYPEDSRLAAQADQTQERKLEGSPRVTHNSGTQCLLMLQSHHGDICAGGTARGSHTQQSLFLSVPPFHHVSARLLCWVGIVSITSLFRRQAPNSQPTKIPKVRLSKCSWTQTDANDRKKSATQVRRRAGNSAKGHKRELSRKICKQPGLKQQGLGTPNIKGGRNQLALSSSLSGRESDGVPDWQLMAHQFLSCVLRILRITKDR